MRWSWHTLGLQPTWYIDGIYDRLAEYAEAQQDAQREAALEAGRI